MGKMKKVDTVTQIESLINDTEKELDYKGIKFKIKNYISAMDKLSLLHIVAKFCFADSNTDTKDIKEKNNSNDEMRFYNEQMKNIVYPTLLVEYYTDIELDNNDLLENYDLLKQSGLLDFVLENINEVELLELGNALDSRIVEEYGKIDREQQFGNILMNLVNKLAESLPEIIKALEEFDMDKLVAINSIKDILSNGGNLQ